MSREIPERVTITTDRDALAWLRGHLADELPSLVKLAETPPRVRNGEALENAREILARIDEVIE